MRNNVVPVIFIHSIYFFIEKDLTTGLYQSNDKKKPLLNYKIRLLYRDKVSKQWGSHMTVALIALKPSIFSNANGQITETGK
jgi:hypothetical protein